MKPTPYILLLILISWNLSSYSQELRGLNYNPIINGASKTASFKSGEAQQKLTIPLHEGNIFFDDFSVYGTRLFPESNNWLDKSATVTRTFADSVISIGVITLDCFNSNGKVYGPVGRINPSDTLTSAIIDSITDDNLFLSFFIQGGGKADPPEAKDSIVLDFFYSNSSVWVSAWDTQGYESHSFKQIIIPIHDSLLSDSSFQFRFRNFTSLSTNETTGGEGALSNADNWHIDYIQIKSATNADEMKQLDDVTIYRPFSLIFQDYSLIPYSHIKYAAGYYGGIDSIGYRTYFPNNPTDISIGRTHMYIDIVNDEVIELVGQGDGIQSTDTAFGFIEKTDAFFPKFTTRKHPEQIKGVFQMKSYIQPDKPNQYRWNDTIIREDIYQDFYAYDDGSAEFGFGITGADTYGSAFATQFNIYHLQNVADTLTGVYLYFNHAANDFNSELEFRIAVWSNNADSPGDLIFATSEDDLYTPDTITKFNNPTNSTNGFMRINFEEDILIPESFYLGILQYTNEFLNVGYDISRNTKYKTMYYSDNTWNSLSSLPNMPGGSLMIRPIFDHYKYSSIKEFEKPEQFSVNIYPNPAKDYITIDLYGKDIYAYRYRVIDILGKELLAGRLLSNALDISQLPSGMYILQVQDQNTKRTYSHKLLKTAY